MVEMGQVLPPSLVQTWPRHSRLNGESEAGIKPPHRSAEDLARVPRCTASDPLMALLEFPSETALRRGTALQDHARSHWQSQDLAPRAPLRFALIAVTGPTKPLEIRSRPRSGASPNIKRRRYASDVDGPNTAILGCKKRRLRAHLITSRLSRPFSQPATHILNREGQESGDKRFLKMATSIDATKRLAHLHSTSFLRFSVMNRLRRRLGMCQRESDRAEVEAIVRTSSKLKSLQAASPERVMGSSALTARKDCPLPTVSAAPGPSGRESGSKPINSFAATHGCRISNPAALPLPAADLAATMNRTSLRIDPIQSPELRPSLELSSDGLEEDSFAFLHPDNDDWDDLGDDSEHVYSDFGVIFGGGSSTDTEAQEEHSYEEYLDELDGISWVTR